MEQWNVILRNVSSSLGWVLLRSGEKNFVQKVGTYFFCRRRTHKIIMCCKLLRIIMDFMLQTNKDRRIFSSGM
jgi:hypothetical protein